MPYITQICSKCQKKQETYHNVSTCKKCGKKALVFVNRCEARGKGSVMHENRILRAEVNDLRNALGWGVKYREWESTEMKGPRT